MEERIQQLKRTVKELNDELTLYDKSYRALVDQVNAMEPDIRVQQLHQALEEEKAKKQRLRERLRGFLEQRSRVHHGPKPDAVAKSKRRHQHRRVNRRRRLR